MSSSRRPAMLAGTAGLAVLLVVGCASRGELPPAAQPIAIDTLQAARSLAPAQHDDGTWPAADWWRALGDRELDVLVDEALAGNPDLALAQARVQAAGAAAGVALAERGPALKANASVSGARLPATVLPAPLGGSFGWMHYGYASFGWDLDLWGGKRAAWEAALGQANATAVDLHAARIAVSTSVARAWAGLGHAATQRKLANAELDRARKARELTVQRIAAGIDGELERQRTDAEVAQGERQLAAASRVLDAARVALAVLLGKGPDRGLELPLPRGLLALPAVVPADLEANLLGQRPDIVAARMRVEAAGRELDAAQTLFLPNISLGAMAGLAARGSETILQLPARFFQVAPAVSLPLFDSGRLQANLAGRHAGYDLAVAAYNKTLVDALGQIATLVQASDSLAAQEAAQARALSAANRAWQLAEQRYRAGVGSFLEALDARRGLLAAEQADAGIRAERIDLSIQLVQALGGGYGSPVRAPGQPARQARTPAASIPPAIAAPASGKRRAFAAKRKPQSETHHGRRGL